MIAKLLNLDSEHALPPQEGALYKNVTISGHTFRLIYGYYEEFERNGLFNEPMPIYPDFIKEPLYTEGGVPFVTAMQDICSEYVGKPDGDSCSDCSYFQRNADLFGFCKCPKKQRASTETEVTRDE